MAMLERFTALRKEVEGTVVALADLRAAQEAVSAAPIPSFPGAPSANAGESATKGSQSGGPPYPAPAGYYWTQNNINGAWELLRTTIGGPNSAGGTGGSFGVGGPADIPVRAPDTTPGRGGLKKPTDPGKIELVSWNGTIKTSLKFLLGCLQQGTCFRTMVTLPGNTLPVEVFDASAAFVNGDALFPTAQLQKGTKLGGGGGGGGASASGAGGGLTASTGGSATPPPPAGSTISGKALTVTVAAPSRPSPGELLIRDGVRELTDTVRQLVRGQRDDMGLGLRRTIR